MGVGCNMSTTAAASAASASVVTAAAVPRGARSMRLARSGAVGPRRQRRRTCTCGAATEAQAAAEDARKRCEEQLLQCSSMGQVYDSLTTRLEEHVLAANASAEGAEGTIPEAAPLVVGLCGMPGSGKSSISSAVCTAVNKKLQYEAAVVVPMDGFHYYRMELDQMEDPQEAHARRGAPWTFNARAFVDRVALLRGERCAEVVRFPAFEHAKKDPEEDVVEVLGQHQVILVEGNYLLLQEPVWEELRTCHLIDEFWYVDVDLEEAMERVHQRHVRENGESEEGARVRVDTNDALNARLIEQQSPQFAHLLIPSLPL